MIAAVRALQERFAESCSVGTAVVPEMESSPLPPASPNAGLTLRSDETPRAFVRRVAKTNPTFDTRVALARTEAV